MSYRPATPAASRLVHLAQGDLHRIVNGEGTLIACLADRIWITQDDDARDIVLGPGESFRIDRPGLTIINAFGAATIAVLPGHAADSRAAA
jgi:hypothetical protein